MRMHRRWALVGLLVLIAAAGSGAALAYLGQVKEFKIPPPGGASEEIAVGSDGALWFTEMDSGRVGRFANGTFSSFALPIGGVPLPESIANGPDGALWVTDAANDLIWRVTTAGKITSFKIPPCSGCAYSGGSGVGNIVLGSDKALWYSRPGNNAIGRITTTGQVHEFPVGGNYPGWIANGPDGAIWYTVSDGIARMSMSGQVTEPWRGLNYPSALTTGPDGKLWFTGVYQDEVGSLTTSGQARLFPLGDYNCSPEAIASGDGSLWVPCSGESRIYRVSTQGTLKSFAVPSDFSDLGGIVQAPDGSIWFTDLAHPLLGQLLLH